MKNIIIGVLVIAVVVLAVLGLSNKEQEVDEVLTETEIETVETQEESNENEANLVSFMVYFNSTAADPELLQCNVVYPVLRQVPYTQAVGMAALNELIAGPTATETLNGYLSNIPTNSQINSLSISAGIAYVDVDSTFFQVGGSCGSASAINALRETLMQFPTVQQVDITINGVDLSSYAENWV